MPREFSQDAFGLPSELVPPSIILKVFLVRGTVRVSSGRSSGRSSGCEADGWPEGGRECLWFAGDRS